MLKKFYYLLFIGIIGCDSRDDMAIVFGGDVMLDRGVKLKADQRGMDYLLNDISHVFTEADYGVVNLECPIGTEPTPLTKKYVFLGNPESLTPLRSAGITHAIMANNHAYDHGRRVMTGTAKLLLENNIIPIGYGISQQDACTPVILEKGDIKVALFASVTLGLEAWMYLEDEPGMCQSTISDLVSSIKVYKENNPNSLIIVSLHWGLEYQRRPTSIQRREARALVSAGADAIIGHHPHVVQSYENIDGHPVFYSVGNLLFDNQNPITHDGILVKLVINADRKIRPEIIPYHAEDCKPYIMPNPEKSKFIIELQKRSELL
ncbi:CapA family protein [Fulvivirga ligni]|uniref:CapA family protein n=1 Tax=Fulvivirga ligni TaxID=2904246 RepID=UPI001F46CB4D|nr:CapA family protein [Fulvivirga ligni]UII19415.1 CapA family protein [Fulvivirga ligni]